jgi:hypothetical protein
MAYEVGLRLFLPESWTSDPSGSIAPVCLQLRQEAVKIGGFFAAVRFIKP